jgi:hypothetical protein
MADVTGEDLLQSLGVAGVIGYVVLWVLLFIHCLRRKAFFPVFGHGRWTRLFWLVSFLFFNPLLTLLYGLFGVLASPKAKPSRKKTAFVSGMVALVAASGWILPLLPRGPVSLVRDPASGEMKRSSSHLLDLDVHAGSLGSNQNTSTATVVRGAGGRLACRHIQVVAESPGLLLDRVARHVQSGLAELPIVRKVDYFPAGTIPPVGSGAPDLVVALRAGEVRETRLPMYRHLRVALSVNSAPTRYAPNVDTDDELSPPILRFSSETSVEFRSTMWGVELLGARYGQESKSLGADIAKGLAQDLTKWRDEHGLLPEMPEAFRGVYREPVEFPFLEAYGAILAEAHSGLMTHNESVWRLADTGDIPGVLEGIEGELAPLGWVTEHRQIVSDAESHLRMAKETEMLLVHSHRAMSVPLGATTERFLVMRYEDRFDHDERMAALNSLVDGHASIEALLTFSESLREAGYTDALESRLRHAGTAEARLALAEILLDRDEKDQALAILDEARVLVPPMAPRPPLDEFKKLYERAGLELPEDLLFNRSLPDKALLKRVGYIDYDADKWPVERIVAPGEFITLHGNHKDGGTGRMWIRMQPVSGTAGACSMETTEQHMGASSHSWGYASLGPGDHLSQAATYQEHWLHDVDKPLILEVELLENGSFRFAITGGDEQLAMCPAPRDAGPQLRTIANYAIVYNSPAVAAAKKRWIHGK